MAHFAKLNELNTVTQVIVVANDVLIDQDGFESEEIGIAFCRSLFGDNSRWKQTSYSGLFRRQFAGVGFTYDESHDAFISPKPFTSWVLDEETYSWKPPISSPDDGQYYWDEPTLSWQGFNKLGDL